MVLSTLYFLQNPGSYLLKERNIKGKGDNATFSSQFPTIFSPLSIKAISDV